MNIISLDRFQKSDANIKEAFAAFMNQPMAYRNNFLQSNYRTAFDGYSYMGQEDSLNQYGADRLHSFVISDLQNINAFPSEFHDFLSKEWTTLTTSIRDIELELVQKHHLPFASLYESDAMAYMMSCNYYPKMNPEDISDIKQRLSAHTDASLFTTFPFGIQDGLSYLDENEYVALGSKTKAFLFNGYFSEWMSNGTVSALKHQVELPDKLDAERYSFAIFSIPKPDSEFSISNKKMTGKEYYAQYLSLF